MTCLDQLPRSPKPLFAAAAVSMLAFGLCFPSAAFAQWWKNRDGCMVTEHIDGRGKQLIIDAGRGYSYVGGKWNDRISTVICEVFCRIEVWEHRDFRGAHRVFTDNDRYVGGAWNDKISSLKVYCDP